LLMPVPVLTEVGCLLEREKGPGLRPSSCGQSGPAK
jgi:hypothetical protein